MNSKNLCVIVILSFFSMGCIAAETSPDIRAEVIADDLIQTTPGLIDVIFHVTEPGKSENTVIAAHLRKAVGEKSDEDDLGVIKTKTPRVEVQKDGVRIGVLVPLLDHSQKVIGAIGLMYTYKAGENEKQFLNRSETIRDDLKSKINSTTDLFTKEESQAGLIPRPAIELRGKPGKFDFMNVDPVNHRVLSAHKGASALEIFDVETGKQLTVNTGDTQGVSLDAKNGRYFLGNDTGHNVVIVNANTLKKESELKLGSSVDAIIYNEKDGLLYAAEDDGDKLWVINPNTAKLESTIKITGIPEGLALSADGKTLYVNLKDKDSVAVIDLENKKMIHAWSTLPVKSPHGLAIDLKRNVLYVSGSNAKLVAMDTQKQKVTSEADIDAGNDQIAFDADKDLIFTANKGFISVTQVLPSTLKPVGRIATPAGAHSIALDAATHTLWVSYSDQTHSYLKSFQEDYSSRPSESK